LQDFFSPESFSDDSRSVDVQEKKPMDKEQALATLSLDLGVPPDWLRSLIEFESGWNPKATNKITGARGLIQFMPDTARALGFKDADDLVNQYPDAVSQLLNPVRKYFHTAPNKPPYPTKQSLFMSVFYPAARSWSIDTVFPDSVRRANPNITTVGDYVNFVEKRMKPVAKIGIVLLVGALCVGGYFLYKHYSKKGGSLWQTDQTEQTEDQVELM
jgi:Transglycosylase SLT domain